MSPHAPWRLLACSLALTGILSLAGLPSPACSASKPAAASASAAGKAEVSEKQADLSELRGKIESLRKDLSSKEESRAEIADQLKDTERSISEIQRNLRELSGERQQIQRRLRTLEHESTQMGARLHSQQQALERLLQHQIRQASPDALQLLLNGDDPNQIARDLYYLEAIARARGSLLREISASIQKKKSLAAAASEQAAELASNETKHQAQRSQLLSQQQERKVMLERIASQVRIQKKEIGALQRDEKRLSQLIDKLSQLIAERAARAQQEARLARERELKAAQQAARDKAGKESSPHPDRPDRNNAGAGEKSNDTPASGNVAINERLPEALPGKRFSSLKGQLRLPVRGTITNRFGSTRQEGSPWKGLFIRTDAGTEVHAMAQGRVVFADWMRGFGNLLIVDHGEDFLSIYGYNEALLKRVGDIVRGGDSIATVGNSGGHSETGLYFELRHRGQPVDPGKWASLK